jgi:hypothetical protein
VAGAKEGHMPLYFYNALILFLKILARTSLVFSDRLGFAQGGCGALSVPSVFLLLSKKNGLSTTPEKVEPQ